MILPDPIPVYVGDDWSFAFSYREGGTESAAVDLTGDAIVCQLYYPYSPYPMELTEAAGQAGMINAPGGQFGVGVTRDITAGFIPAAPKGAAALSIAIDTGTQRRTIAVWPLRILDRRMLLQAPLINLETIDPLNGRVLHFDGLTTLVPTIVSGRLQFDFSQPSNFISQGL